MPPVNTEVLERPALTADEAQAIAESKPGVELIPNLTPSPEVTFISLVNSLPVQAVDAEAKVKKSSRFTNSERKK